ncbi:MAG: apolipoprotein N-acyltransferase [Actinobacteria bacterium]|nr:apolipoprotein N-acyltransferase [Actinomycetota bacterium]
MAPRLRIAAVALTAGLLLAASIPPWGWWPAAFPGIAILDRLLADQPPGRRFVRTLLVTVAWLAPGTLWMWDLTPPGWLIVLLIQGAFFGLAAMAIPAGRGRRVGLVGAVTLAEFVRWSVPFGGVPLATLPMGQAGGPLAPVVRVGGPLLLVALVVVIGVGLSALADGRRADNGSVIAVAGAMGAVVLCGVLAALAPSGHVVGEIDVALVQGGGPQRTRATPTGAAIVFANQLEAAALVETPVDLVLWPENVVNPSPEPTTGGRFPDRIYADDATAALEAEAGRLDAVLVPGWFHRHPTIPTANLNYSTAIEPDGTVVDAYDKVLRVPFGEFVPLRGLVEAVAGGDLPARDLLPGTGSAVLETSVGRLGVSISWEVFFEHRTRDAARNGAQVLLNPTNGASYWLTVLQSQQVASSRLRALETGRWLLQAAPTGFSAVIDAQGRVLVRTGVSEQAVLHATVELREGDTWATRFGPWPMLALALGLLIAARSPTRRESTTA